MDIDSFEKVILNALEEIPDKFKERMKNISIIVDEGSLSPVLKKQGNPRYTLGLYQGLPLTLRAGRRNNLPDKITIYKKSIEAVSNNEKELIRNIRRVVFHEVGHYFGLDEKKLRKLGF
jgi:predicted Zn-dependent protease with MMP-like domain